MANIPKSRLIILGSIGIIVLFFILLLTGIIPGKRTDRLPPTKLTVWGVFDDERVIQEIAGLAGSHFDITYKEVDIRTYESELINALAAGKGPDIFMIHNTWLPKHFDKLFPVSEEQLSISDFGAIYPTVIKQDFAPDGFIYALPLYLDTLALIYNRDIFDQESIVLPPKTWDEFQNIIPQLRTLDGSGKITRAAAAIGGSSKNVNRATDVLSALFLQQGVEMTSNDYQKATFDTFRGEEVLRFYTKFANPANSFYTWNDNFVNSIDGFADESVAMILNYRHQIPLIQEKNPFINLAVAPLPQFSGTTQEVNFANYWGFAVSNTSQNVNGAWNFILSMTATPEVANAYAKKTGRLPALRTLISQYINDPELAVFAKSALTARSWPQPDPNLVENTFSNMIQQVVNGQATINKALSQAADTITQALVAR